MIPRMIALTLTLGVTMMVGACKKQESQSSPPPSTQVEPAADQSASIWADPDNIPQGGSASLTWRTRNATEVSIEAVGGVPTNGSLSVSPAASTIYRLTAKGARGTLDVTTKVTVNQLPPSHRSH